MKHIKDPIHGYIDVPDQELSIINSSEFQRLRRIKQLGLSSTVYPSACHTRFSHSLGVMHLAEELGSSINMTDKAIRENSVAGLLHDFGHLPFSHTFESLFESKTGLTHEDLSCRYIDNIAEHNDVQFPCDIENVKNIIKGEYDGINLISNEIDCDRLDYLLRDSYNTGIQLGRVEYDTLIKFAQIIDSKLGFDHKSLRSIERLLDARMQMNYSVYSHNTVNITETMVESSVRYHFENTDDDIIEVMGLDDQEMAKKLLKSDYGPAKEIYSRVRNRDLYKNVYYNPLRSLDSKDLKNIEENIDNIQKHESNIAELAEVPEHYILLSVPEAPKVRNHKTPIRMPNGDVKNFENVSPKPESLRRSHISNQSLMVFSPKEVESKVKKVADEYLTSILDI